MTGLYATRSGSHGFDRCRGDCATGNCAGRPLANGSGVLGHSGGRGACSSGCLLSRQRTVAAVSHTFEFIRQRPARPCGLAVSDLQRPSLTLLLHDSDVAAIDFSKHTDCPRPTPDFCSASLRSSGLPGGLLMPIWASRRPDQRVAVVLVSSLTGIGLVGLLVAPPGSAVLWAILNWPWQRRHLPTGTYAGHSPDEGTGDHAGGMGRWPRRWATCSPPPDLWRWACSTTSQGHGLLDWLYWWRCCGPRGGRAGGGSAGLRQERLTAAQPDPRPSARQRAERPPLEGSSGGRSGEGSRGGGAAWVVVLSETFTAGIAIGFGLVTLGLGACNAASPGRNGRTRERPLGEVRLPRAWADEPAE